FYDRHRMSGGQGARLLIVSRGDGSFFDAAHSGDLPLIFPGEIWHNSFLDYGKTTAIAGPELRRIWAASPPPAHCPECPSPASLTSWAEPSGSEPPSTRGPEPSGRGEFRTCS